MKSILISIQPKWCELIASGKKTIEVRKTRPKIETPFKCYIYMTATKERCMFWEYITAYQNSNGDILDGSQKVIGEFVCDRIINLKINGDDCGNYWHEWTDECDIEDMCLSYEELEAYFCKNIGYGWHISDLKIYDKPKDLREFFTWRFGKNDGCDTCFNKKWWEGDTADENIAKRICAPCQKDNFRKQITRPPQSWCYVEETE